MSIELRLRSLEARKAAQNGVFLILPENDGTVSFTTKKGKKMCFRSAEEAKEAIYNKYGEVVIIIWDI